MAENKIEVIFGAQVAGLVNGVKEAERLIKGLVAPIEEVTKSFRGIGEALGISYAVEKIGELVEKMAEVGEHAVNMGTALGMSAEQFQQLNEAMSLVGASGDALVRTERMLARAAEEAVSSPLSKQAAAFDALKIKAKDFGETLSTDPIRALKQLADAMVSTGNTALTGPIGFLLGKSGGADVVRFFSEGAGGIDKLIAKVKELGAPSKELLDGQEKIAKQLHETTIAMLNFGLQVADTVKGPLKSYLNWLTESYSLGTQFLKGLPQPGPGAAGIADSHPILGASQKEMEILAEIRRRESGGDYKNRSTESTASGAYQMIDETWRRWASAAGIDTGKYPTAADAPVAFQDAAAFHGLRAEGFKPWEQDPRGMRPGGYAKQFGEGTSSTTLPDMTVTADAEAAVQKTRMENYTEQKKAAEERIKQIEQETKAKLAQLDFELQSGRYNAETVHTLEQQKIATTQEGEAAKQAVIKGTSDVVQREMGLEHDATTRTIGLQRQALESDQKLQSQREAVEIKRLDAAEKLELQEVERRKQFNEITLADAVRMEEDIVKAHETAVGQILRSEAQKVELTNETDLKLKKIEDDANNERKKAAQEVGQEASHALSGAAVGLITGKQTGAQAAAGLGEAVLSKVMDTVMEKTAGKLITTAVQNLLQQLAGDVLNTTVLTADNTANTAILAELLLMLLVKPSFLGTTALHGGIVPSAAGGWAIPSFQGGGIPAIVHPGEMVLPKHLSEGVQNMIGKNGAAAGDMHMHFHGPADGPSIQRWFRDNMMSNSGAIRDMFRYNALTPRTL